jgi:hypothetical protein
LILLCGVAAYAAAPELGLSRFTIDGGGVMRSTGGRIELSGTIGQPDAGTMTARGIELTGGFWFPLAPGDCNSDGGVNLIDHGDLTSCFTGPDGRVADSPCPCFDQDGDGDVDLFDFAEMQLTFSGS